MSSNIPTLNSRAAVIDLSDCLGSLYHLLDTINNIMKLSHLDDCELQHYGHKIITLTDVIIISILVNSSIMLLVIKVVCMTLRYQRLDLSLGLFALCSKKFPPYKSAYFKLLVWIRWRKAAFPAGLNDRINVLLFTIGHGFVVQRKGVNPHAQLGIEELLVPRNTNPLDYWIITSNATAPAAAAVSSEPKTSTSPSEIPNKR
ncbi:hypothetical protein DFJ58DRAFT_913169 [Suillus subalutaceus]|uniref:uncharacterized protein n=1 Tax=Suillus subalutaceus TaxID=48586 RepID=UPI001B87D1AD|nr:uncharacterized protein DFJ58DRAFT_913169 [Suillus subalutaceus]KAG1859344.1 hypothetical protein DFJ58DRAFT_913169 [Suillus subalutaceus]